VLGAVRAGIRTVLVPKDNEADLEDLPRDVRDELEIYLAEDLGEVLALTLRGASYKEGRLLFGDLPLGTPAPQPSDVAVQSGDAGAVPYTGSLH